MLPVEAKDSKAEALFVADTQASSGAGGSRPDTRKHNSQVDIKNVFKIASNGYFYTERNYTVAKATAKCKSTNTTKGIAFTSRGAEVSYHIIGATSYQCVHYNATMWYDKRINKGNRKANSLYAARRRTNARQYNKSTIAEVAALITNDFGDGKPLRHLFQQYWVDAYSAVEEQRLKWTQNNQDTLRVDLYPNLENDSKCKTAAQIADIISAKMPSPMDDPDRYKAVTDYMLQGPCGKDGKYALCTIEGKCSKHYPKQFYAETVLDEDGYPIYRRHDNKASCKKGKFTFDNRHVVPPNRYLLLKYQAHINVEW
ncbi:hypothetical protein Tco_0267257 [Tanacetum coccineum]